MAEWPKYLKDEQTQRLEEIQGRLDRLNARRDELYAEKKRIMNAAIKRMRRAKGKV